MKKLIFSVLALLLIETSFAVGSTYETGKDGLVIKEAWCPGRTYLSGVAINRTAQLISGKLEISVLDADGDFVWRGVVDVDVGPLNGQNINAVLKAGNCDESQGKRIAFRFLD